MAHTPTGAAILIKEHLFKWRFRAADFRWSSSYWRLEQMRTPLQWARMALPHFKRLPYGVTLALLMCFSMQEQMFTLRELTAPMEEQLLRALRRMADWTWCSCCSTPVGPATVSAIPMQEQKH